MLLADHLARGAELALRVPADEELLAGDGNLLSLVDAGRDHEIHFHRHVATVLFSLGSDPGAGRDSADGPPVSPRRTGRGKGLSGSIPRASEERGATDARPGRTIRALRFHSESNPYCYPRAAVDATTFRAKTRANARRAALLVVAASSFGLCGCPAKTTVATAVAPKPNAGVSLTVSCPDPALAAVLAPAARAWAQRTGAAVTVANGPGGDIVVLPAAAFGAACAKGEFLPLPPNLRDPGHPFVMSGLPDAVTEGLAGWAGRPTGILLRLDAAVLVYRKDRFEDQDARNTFRTKFQRDLGPPTSWEDALAVANFFREKDGRPASGPCRKTPPHFSISFTASPRVPTARP